MAEKKLCKRCWIEKDLTPEFWIRDKSMKNWFSYRCKKCMHELSKEASHKYAMSHREKTHEYNIRYNQEHKEEIRAKRRWNREKEKIKRRERMKEIYIKSKVRRKEMWYSPIHQSVCRLIKKLWIRPKCCPICWYESKPIAHHPDYSKPYEIIFCCNSCHRLIHLWQIEIDKNTIIKLCESEWNKMITKCITCWASIHKIWGAKYCKECKKIAQSENSKRYREKKKTFNS